MWTRLHGLGQALLASVLFSACSVLVKSSEVPIGQTSFLSNSVMFCCSLPVALYRRDPLFPKGHRLQLVLFSVLSVLTVLANYKAVRLMPLGDEAVIAYTSIIFTIVLARVILAEPYSKGKILCSICIIVGVALLSYPFACRSSYPDYRTGCLLTLFGAIFDATSYIVMKQLSELHCSTILISCGLASMIVTGPMCFLEGWFMPTDPTTLVAITVLTFLHDILLVLAVSTEEAGLVSLIQASDIVFSYVWELIFFEESYSFLRLIGAGMVTSSVFLAAITGKQSTQKILDSNKLPLFLKNNGSKFKYEMRLKAEELMKCLDFRGR